MVALGRDTSLPITKSDFQQLVMDPEISKVMDEAGSDPIALLETSEIIFEKFEKEGGDFTFEAFIEVILNTRGANPATVKDVKDILRILGTKVDHSETEIMKSMTEQMHELRMEMHA